MNNNANLDEPALVSSLAASVLSSVERADVALLKASLADLMPERWARELAATIACRLDLGESLDDAAAEVIEQRMKHPDAYTYWKDVGLSRALRIYAAMLAAWVSR